MLVFILGNNGSGKTGILTYLATKFKKNIYSNYVLKLPNYYELTIKELINIDKLKEGNIFLDEAYAWIDSRTSGNALNLLTSYLIYQKRKRLLDIYLTAQMFSSIDLRARYLANIIIECHTRVNQDSDDFYYTYNDLDIGITSSFTIPYEIFKNYFKYYDTYQIIEPHIKNKLEFEVLKDDPIAMIEKLKEISNVIKPDLKKITHDNIKISLLLNRFDIKYEKYLYYYLKGNINLDNY